MAFRFDIRPGEMSKDSMGLNMSTTLVGRLRNLFNLDRLKRPI